MNAVSGLVLLVVVVVAGVSGQRGGARIQQQQQQEFDDRARRPTTTPVPILKQINKVDEDGSYTYGYEAADGTYKIESKTANGEVKGKYGYFDDTGVLREIEYGASRQGFNPRGTDVKPPESALAMAYDPFDDTGYYDPEKYERPFAYDPASFGTTVPQQQQQQVRRPVAGGRRPGGRRLKNQQQHQFTASVTAPQQQQHFVNHQVEQQQPQQQAPAPVLHHRQQQYYQPQQPQPQQQTHFTGHHQSQLPQAPAVPNFHPSQLFHGHPAKNIDINTGSFSVQYSG